MENYKFNPVTKTLIVSAAFAKAMNNPSTPEYQLYIQLQHDIPGLKVSRRSHKSPSKCRSKSGEVFRCNQYKHLTYENMERFIAALPQHDKLMENYNYLRYDAGLVQTSCYAAVRRWFEAQFPDFRTNPLFYLEQNLKIITDLNQFTAMKQEESESYPEAS